MNVIPLQLFVSLMLVSGSILLLAYSIKHRDHDHADRLSLLPLEDDRESSVTATERAAAQQDPGSSTKTALPEDNDD